MSIENVIISSPSLPDRFISTKYDRFLFFDFSIRRDFDFYAKFQRMAGADREIDVFYSRTLNCIAKTASGIEWANVIKECDEMLEKNEEHFGLAVADRNLDWLLVQNSPVEWGVLAFDSKAPGMMNLYDSIDRSWVLSIDDFKFALDHSDSLLHETFDMDFIKRIILNYSHC